MNLTLTQKHLLAGVIALTITIVLALSFYTKAKGAISSFTPSTCYTAAATSTLSYLTAGTGTTTVSCLVGPDGASTARLNVEVNASSTSSQFNFNAEESMDNQDWYPITLPQGATTTSPFNVSARYTYTAIFASSTIGGTGNTVSLNGLGVNGTINRNHYSFDIPVTMRYVRVYSSLPAGSTSGGVWMQILPRQNIN